MRSPALVRLAGLAGVAGGCAWMVLAVLWLAVGGGATLLGYGMLDALASVAFALALAGVAGYRAQTVQAWGRLATAGFAIFAAGLAVTVVASLVYVVSGVLEGWTVSVWSYLLAMAGATLFGTGLLWAGVPPRSGATLLAGTLPVGIGVSLAVGSVLPDEAVIAAGPGVLIGAGIATVGCQVWRTS